MAELFDDIFKESKIFSNREVLSPHYIPQNLLFRDKQIQEIAKYLTPSLKGERGRNIFIYGKTGTGKTSCVKSVIDKVKNLPVSKARIIYINCRIYNSRYRVLYKIVSDYLPLYAKRGYGIVDIYEKIINWIDEDGKILVVVLDEVDIVKDLDDLIYTLTRANSDIKSGGITIVGVSNKVSFKDELDPRSLSALYENELVFPPYNSNELSSILKDRAENGFRKDAIEPAAINLAAALAAKESGDARLALKIMSKAGELAEEKGAEIITVHNINEAAKYAEEEIAYDLINTLPEHQRLIVYAIALLSIQGSKYKRLSDGADSYLFSGDIYDKYCSVSNSLQKEPKSSRWYRKYIADLDMQGIITSYESGKGIRGHTKLIRLAYVPEKIKSTIEKALYKEVGADNEKVMPA
ncbi:MAG: AAA family ATPase [Candidatus Micrarchaeota archaeon]|nr:AAA family ATPase [Candidatus Micrarchaeota archaeon]MDE1859062.1 AAA family ATPase [Candidatus Micrarchaeota archaeon]